MVDEDKISKLLAEAESERILELEKANLSLLRQLDKAKNKTERMVEAVYEAVKTGLSTYRAGKIPPPNLPPIKKKGKEIA